ncbi:MAG: hypothetical protein IPF88_04635 [Candidatus Microthrix sp.]|nr:hypothetical protein [Candidatus Microthrix sp.]MBK6437886.1 hypothetical protein [Candidatus Microthrix sp.]
MLIGVGVFLLGDYVVDKRFGSEGAAGRWASSSAPWSMGSPESLIFGIQIGIGATISPTFLAAVFVSNIPQAIAPSADLAGRGWGPARLGRLWVMVVLGCGVAAGLGYLLTTCLRRIRRTSGSPRRGGVARHVDQLLDPVRLRARGKQLAGVATVVGFCLTLLGT